MEKKKTKQNKGRKEERKEKMGVQKTEERGMEAGRGEERRGEREAFP